MKTFFAALSDGGTMKKPAEKMDIVENSIRVYCCGELVAYLDLGEVLYAQIC